jgi:zinc transporter ZupT
MGASAAGFIYIAMADLVPNLHHSRRLGQNAGQLALILGGIGTVAVLHLYL